MPLTSSDIQTIRNLLMQEFMPILSNRIVDELQRRRTEASIGAPLPHKLTVAEFAWCVQRSVYSIQERRRNDRKFRAYCEGGCRVKIHPAALELFGADSGLAAARLKTFKSDRQKNHRAQIKNPNEPLPHCCQT